MAVLSGKGGVGKTNVAVNLAICLAGRGLRVTLLDADLGLANADLLLDVSLPHNLSHVISGLRQIDQVGRVVAGGVFFVPGASGLERVANLSEFERQRLLASWPAWGREPTCWCWTAGRASPRTCWASLARLISACW